MIQTNHHRTSSKMPYNVSKACVRRMSSFLDQMNTAKSTLTWPAKDPRVFAYKIREAMWAATKHPEFSHLHHLKDNYRIRPYSGWVEAEWIGTSIPESRAQSPKAMEVQEAINAAGVVGACIKFREKADELHFPKAVLSERDLLAIYKWGLSEDPPWKLIFHDGAGVTMTRKRGVHKIFLWSPPEGEKDEED